MVAQPSAAACGMKRALKERLLAAWMRRMARVRPPGRRADRPARIALWQFGGVGDMVLATPVIAALERAYPEAKIHLWCSDPAFAALLSRFPNVASISAFRVYDYDARTLLRKDVRRSLRDVQARMQAQRIDLLINLHVPAMRDWWAVEWWLIRRLQPPFSMGFDPPFLRGRSLFDVGCGAAEWEEVHYTERYRRLLARAGIDCDRATSVPLTAEERARARDLLGAEGAARTVCLHVGARRLRMNGAMWPLERFIRLAERLVAQGWRPVVLGVAQERAQAARLCDRVAGCRNLAGATDLGVMAAVIDAAEGFIGHDSGPFHIAAAVGTPAVAICGRPDPEPEYLDYRRDDLAVVTGATPEAIDVGAVVRAFEGVAGRG
ncbi:MAG: lipopolysaccharide heptosyltransferase family protein [Zetaproteobacteria bacterium]|nr:MAG: lipopolysaccharide heptosyltransferase family protein [Zetaproteobacteria bacterium]